MTLRAIGLSFLVATCCLAQADRSSALRDKAEKGNATAQVNLGNLYANGEGVPQDFAEAERWYRKSADQGNAIAQFYLGYMYANGQGVPVNYAEAMRWYRQAADQGDPDAPNNIGEMYANGQGVPADYREAVRWYQKAAQQQNTDAQYNIGLMYRDGKGVPQDFLVAHMWLNLAASKSTGDDQKKYSAARDALAVKMTPQQIAEAQRLTREWEPNKTGPVAASKGVGTTLQVVLHKQGGVLLVPVLINNEIHLDFILDSGASDVSIPADVVSTLMRTGTLTDADFTGTSTYILADGSRVPSQTFRIRSLKIGDRVLENVSGSVASLEGSLLLGQSFLSRFKSWSIDNTRQILILQ